MTNQTSTSYLRQAGVSYGAGGLFLLLTGIPYWFGNQTIDQDPLLKTHHLVGIIHQVNDFKETLINLWSMVLGTIALMLAHYSLWQAGQPTGWSKRYLLLLPLAGSVCHFLCFMLPLPFAPLGTLLTALGMVFIGIVSIRTSMWPGWKRFTPLLVGLFTFMVQVPLFIILGTPPYHILPLWGIPIGLLGLASWQRAKEIDSARFA